MRRLLLIPALALVLVGTPVLAADNPTAPPATTEEVPVAPDQTVSQGWASPVTPIDAEIVGITWDGDPSAEFTVEVQDSAGNWSPARDLDAETSAEAGSKDATRAAEAPDNGTAPVWVGNDAAAVRVVVDAGQPSDVTVAAVDAQATAAPSGSAGAIGSWIPSMRGPSRYLFAVALFALAALLVVIALGWSPWRSRRWRVALAATAGVILISACVPSIPVPNGSVQPAMTMRSQWGARAFGCGTPEYAPALKFAVVHHTVNGNTYGPGDSASLVRGIQAYHMDALKYCDIAYHFLIDRFGVIFEGRAGGITKPVVGGHAGGFNYGSTSAALIGNYQTVGVPTAQFNSLVHLLRWRFSVASVNPATEFWHKVGSSPCNCQRWPAGSITYFSYRILSHRDVDYTECPASMQQRMGELRTQVNAGIVFPPTTSSTTTTTVGSSSVGATASTTSTTTPPTTTTTP